MNAVIGVADILILGKQREEEVGCLAGKQRGETEWDRGWGRVEGNLLEVLSALGEAGRWGLKGSGEG